MEPQRRYTQTVKRAFHISMAALDIASSDNDPTQVMCSSEERNYLLCTLQKDKVVQCALDLTFEVGDRISFATNGNSHVHLTGYLTEDIDDIMEEEDIEEEEEEVVTNKKRGINAIGGPAGKKLKTAEMLDAIKSDSDDSDDESFADVVSKLEEEDDDDDEEEEEEDDDDDDVEDEDDESGEEEESEDEDESDEDAPPPEVLNKKQKLVNGTGTPGKKNNVQAQKKNTQVKTPEANKTPKQEKPKTPNEKKVKQEQKTPKTPKEQPKKRTVEGGVIVEDLKQGEGQVAKPGRICQVYYEGRLKNNNKVFDSTNKGPGFKFRLGKQEVIKGWDVGISGMKVGGKRRIVCPAGMAYGQKGSPPTIPPNATLVFDVELKGLL